MSSLPIRVGNRRARSARVDRLASRFALETLETRDVPSSSIPLNGFTWTNIGPAPIIPGEAPGMPSSTGRVNAMTLDAANVGFTANYPFPSNPTDIYVGSDKGGIWHTFDNGDTWARDLGYGGGTVTAMASVNRDNFPVTGVHSDTVYAFTSLVDGSIEFATSTNSAVSFTRTTSTGIPGGARVDKLVVAGINPLNQTTDILYAAVSTGLNPLTGLANPGAGIYKNAMGGVGPWTRIATSTPGSTTPNFSPTSGFFTDVAIDPTDPNRVYAATGNPAGDSFNGVYRTNNAALPTPVWINLLGGSQFVPGTTPGNVKVAISPVLPSVIFVSAGLRTDPQSGEEPLLGLFRSTDSGANFSPIYIAAFPQTTDPNNYLGGAIGASENNVIVVDPFSPPTASGQRIYLAGNGQGTDRNVIFSNDSGNTLQRIGIGADGVGPYINVRVGQVDQQQRFVVAGGGGVYRLNSRSPVNWTSLNGTPGPNALGVVQFNGFALHPTDPDRATGNISNQNNRIHSAVQFADAPGRGNAAYGWATVDSGPSGTGQVIYNPFNPNIIYRVTDSSGTDPIRRTINGGTTWTTQGTGYQAYPYQGGFATPALAIDPSRPNRLFSGYSDIRVTDNDAGTWRNQIQTTLNGTLNFPSLPTAIVNENAAAPDMPSFITGEDVPITAIGSGRQSIGGLGGVGTLVLAGTTDDVEFDMMAFDYQNNALPGTQLWVNVIPDVPQSAFAGLQYDRRSWAKITPADAMGTPLLAFGEFITQILTDPLNDPNTVGNTLYIYTSAGRILRGDFSFGLNPMAGPNGDVVQGLATSTWVDISGNVPQGALVNSGLLVNNPMPLALDKGVVLTGGLNGPRVDRLYVGTNNGVFALDDPRKDFSVLPPSWNEVGVTFDPITNQPIRSLPPAAASVLSINASTGILAAATYGLGVYEIQIRGLIRGRIFEDENGNGVSDPGELPFAGISVTILDVDNNLQQVATDDTDANGFYEFRSLRAGNYRVVVADPGGNLIQTTAQPNPALFLNFTEQTTRDGVDFGYFQRTTASGTKFEDLNSNGTQDAGEAGIAGFRIYIDYDGNGAFTPGVDPTQISDANGQYTFTNIGPDVILGDTNFVSDPAFPNYPRAAPYIFREVQQTGFRATIPVEGGFRSVTTTSGDPVSNVDFGNVRIAQITGSKFEDTNGNGVFNAGEPPVAGIDINLLDAATNAILRTVTTDAAGNYQFLSLMPGNYLVREVLPAGTVQTTTNPPAINVTLTSIISATQVPGLRFGNFRTVTVGGTKFNDANGNGTQDAGETGLGGFQFQLINATTNAVVTTTTSAPDGSFTFTDVGPNPNGAPFLVREVPQAGFVQTTPNPPAFPLVSGTDNTTLSFGNFGLYTISGTKFIDSDGDGVRDANERGAPGFIIGLDLGNNGTVDFTTVTAGDGSYSFTNVGPGAVRVFEQPRRGFQQTLPASANGYVFTGVSSTNVAGQDFGNRRLTAFVTGADTGGQPLVVLRDVQTNAVRLQFAAFPLSFRGGVRVASGYFDNDLTPDIVTAAGPGMSPTVRVFRGSDGSEIFTLRPYEASFTGGVYVAVGDVNGDGFDDVITGTGEGGGPFVKVFSGLNGTLLQSYFAYDQSFRGGVIVAAADLNNDGRADVVTGAGVGGGPHVKAFSGVNASLLQSFFPFNSSFRGGVFVATGDVNGDGLPDIITGPGFGGGPQVQAFDGRNLSQYVNISAFPSTQSSPWISGARVASLDFNLDGTDDIIVAAGRGRPAKVRVFNGATSALITEFNAYDPAFLGGVFVGAK